MPQRRRQQGASPPARADAAQRPAGKPRLGFDEFTKSLNEFSKVAKRIMKPTKAAKRIMRKWNAAMAKAKAEPLSPEQWRKEAEKAIAATGPSHLKPIKRATVKKQSALPPGPRPKFDQKKLKQLVKRHPGTNKQLQRLYKQETGTEPSLSWVRDRMQKFRRQKH
jgi:hypothetical protein